MQNTLVSLPLELSQSAHLAYREGGSDKVYHVQLQPQNEGFVVNIAYGRRGTTLQTGTKTSSPVSHEKALTIFNKLVREKKAKGYSDSQDSTRYQGAQSSAGDTGLRPQLLNAVEESEMEALLLDATFCLQEKFDGKRLLVKKTGDSIEAINRKGLRVGMSSALATEVQLIPHDVVLDGESIGDKYHVFDIIEFDGHDLRNESYRARLRYLGGVMDSFCPHLVEVLETASTTRSKRALLDYVRARRGEGVVLKRLDAGYTPGRPHSGGDQLKFKFTSTCSALVTSINSQRSVALQLWKGDTLVDAGNVTIPPNHGIPNVGSVVEIRYYAEFRIMPSRVSLTSRTREISQLLFISRLGIIRGNCRTVLKSSPNQSSPRACVSTD